MKKLLSIAALVGLCLTTNAGNYIVSSFLKQSVLSIFVSNNVAWTNLESITQNGFGGAAPQTNSSGVVTNSVVARGWNWYTNAIPVLVGAGTNASYLPGILTIITNNTPVNPGTNSQGLATNGIIILTNSTFSVFQDVPIEPSAVTSSRFWDTIPGAAGLTNEIGTLFIRSWPNLYNVVGSANAGSNMVNVTFTPVLIDESAPVQGSSRPTKWEPTDLAIGASGASFTVTYTNSAGVLGTSSADPTLPTVFAIPLPAYLMRGANGLRCTKVYSGNTTNGLWIDTIALGHYMP